MDAYIGQPVKFPSYLRQVPHINDNFILRRAVGKGTFGVVFLGVLKGVESERYAFKFLVPTSCLTSYQSEIKVLQALGQHEHVISLLSSVRHLDQVVFVFPYFEHNTFPNIIKSVDHSCKPSRKYNTFHTYYPILLIHSHRDSFHCSL